ncbi:MAG: exodeoxyribonuclease VII small subunit [Bacteroidaceae bacterium]|nr:exodeoxyribonuclease VII small subunit [Bacteroidaceae bacterium]
MRFASSVPPSSPAGEYSYSQAVARLEEIMQAIQSGSVEIDTLYRLLREADELIKFCRTRLYEVDEEVKMLLDSMNEESAM